MLLPPVDAHACLSTHSHPWQRWKCGMPGAGEAVPIQECLSIPVLVPKFLGNRKLQTGVCSWLPGNNHR